jgi:hypothetical protein
MFSLGILEIVIILVILAMLAGVVLAVVLAFSFGAGTGRDRHEK